MKNFEEFDWCMRHKCKSCKDEGECRMLDESLHWRLMWHPFDNLPQILKEKGITYDNRTR